MTREEYDERLCGLVLQNWPTLRIGIFNQHSPEVKDAWTEIERIVGQRPSQKSIAEYFLTLLSVSSLC